MITAPRCGKRIRNWKVCGRPAGHAGNHLSEEAYRRGLDRVSRRRTEGLNVITTHGYGGYSCGCRCKVCKAAKADYMAKRRAAAFVTDSAPERDPAVTHGIRPSPTGRGSRTRSAAAGARNAWPASTPVPVTRNGGRSHDRRCRARRRP
jgi:hypothetical protein